MNCADCGGKTRSCCFTSEKEITPVWVCDECGLINEKIKSEELVPLTVEGGKIYRKDVKSK